MKRRKLILFVVIAVLFIILSAPFAMLFGPGVLRDYIHKELIYKTIVSKITAGLYSDKEKAVALMDYVYTHLFNLYGWKVMDVHPLNDLIRSTGACDQQANTLITLARKARIKGRLIFLRGYDNVSHHSVCELYIDGKFRIFDPHYGIFFADSENNMATFNDIQVKKDALVPVGWPKERHWEREFKPSDHYFRVYAPAYEPINFRRNYEQDLLRFVLSRWIDLYYDLFGDIFLMPYQELYFKLSKADPYLKARLKHLSFRFDSAIEDYENIIKTTSDESLKGEAMFHKAEAYWDKEDYGNAILEFERLLNNMPGYRRNYLVCIFLSECYRLTGGTEKARFYFLDKEKYL